GGGGAPLSAAFTAARRRDGSAPLTAERLASGRQVQPRDVLELARAHRVRMVDFKFTDLPGTWQHLGLSIHALDEESFSEGLGFDGSSIRGFQEIAESDMVLIPARPPPATTPSHRTKPLRSTGAGLNPTPAQPTPRAPGH